MPELRLNVLRLGAMGDQETRTGMAEIVEAHPAEASAPARLQELPVAEVVRIERRASYWAFEEEFPREAEYEEEFRAAMGLIRTIITPANRSQAKRKSIEEVERAWHIG